MITRGLPGSLQADHLQPQARAQSEDLWSRELRGGGILTHPGSCAASRSGLGQEEGPGSEMGIEIQRPRGLWHLQKWLLLC